MALNNEPQIVDCYNNKENAKLKKENENLHNKVKWVEKRLAKSEAEALKEEALKEENAKLKEDIAKLKNAEKQLLKLLDGVTMSVPCETQSCLIAIPIG